MTIDIDETKVERNEFGLWLSWTLATAGGMLLGFLPSIPLVNILSLGFAQIIVPVLTGTIIGFSQWIVLRRYVTASSQWVLADGVSWAVGYILGLFLVQVLPSTVFAAFVGYFLFGVIVALVQWPVLRREIPHILTWIIANAFAWAVGFWASQAVLSLFFHGPSIQPVVSTTMIAVTSGLVAGAITGIALVWIVRKPEVA
ncbi:MAG TPA: hypothetical protein VK249_03055 [Anaerolineales bacterium]|nr:hypothetical protein [Anaerolineales bacterium]